MTATIQVVIEHDDGQVEDVQHVACLCRGLFMPEELGLNLAEAKQIVQDVQKVMVTSQAADYIDRQRHVHLVAASELRRVGTRSSFDRVRHAAAGQHAVALLRLWSQPAHWDLSPLG